VASALIQKLLCVTETLALSTTTCVSESSVQSVTEIAKRKSKKKNAPTIPTMPPRLDLRSVLEELSPRTLNNIKYNRKLIVKRFFSKWHSNPDRSLAGNSYYGTGFVFSAGF